MQKKRPTPTTIFDLQLLPTLESFYLFIGHIRHHQNEVSHEEVYSSSHKIGIK